MINVVYCMRRRADLTLQQFLDHWGNVHAPIVTRNLDVLHLAGYQRIVPCQHEMSPQIERRNVSQAPYDGIALLSWASEEDLQQSLKDTLALEVQRELARDEKLFVDATKSCRWVAEAIRHL
jgi:hypothetical protein